MCRYAIHEYKTHFICLPCKFHAKYKNGGQEQRCPKCRIPMINMGRDFKAPRKEAKNQWRKLEILVENDVRFGSCGCNGPGLRPKTLADAKRLYG